MSGIPLSDIYWNCPRCGYDLRGAVSGKCSECGAPMTRRIPSGIPWRYRGERGWLPAYVGTVAAVIRKPAVLAEAARRGMGRRSARAFHGLSMATALGVGMAALGIGELSNGAGVPWGGVQAMADLTMAGAAALAMYGGLEASAFLCRWTVAGWPSRQTERLRRRRAAWYLSGLAPLEVALLGAAWVLWTVADLGWGGAAGAYGCGVGGVLLAATGYVLLVAVAAALIGHWGAGLMRWVLTVLLLPASLTWMWGMLALFWEWSARLFEAVVTH